MHIISRGIRFLQRYALHHPMYIFWYLLMGMRRGFHIPITFLREREVTAAMRAGTSLIRFGDGEINLLLNLSNHYQRYAPGLKNDLMLMVRDYSKDSPYIFGVPAFVSRSNSELKALGILRIWLPFKIMFWRHFDHQAPYIDAHAFYRDNYFERVISPALTDKHIVLVTNARTIATHKENSAIPWHDHVSYVETPEEDALEALPRITNKIDRVLGGTAAAPIVLCALGPAGKILMYRYAKRGIQCIDVGRAMETMYTGDSIEHLIIGNT